MMDWTDRAKRLRAAAYRGGRDQALIAATIARLCEVEAARQQVVDRWNAGELTRDDVLRALAGASR